MLDRRLQYVGWVLVVAWMLIVAVGIGSLIRLLLQGT